MKAALFTVVGLVVIASLTSCSGRKSGEEMPPIGMAYVELTSDYISNDGRFLLAFLPSGSTDKRVLVSINEHWVRPDDRVDYIAANALTSDVLGPGVQIVALLNSGNTFPKETSLHVTIMQPGAKFGKPRPVQKPIALRQQL